jgi:hypothetical protein
MNKTRSNSSESNMIYQQINLLASSDSPVNVTNSSAAISTETNKQGHPSKEIPADKEQGRKTRNLLNWINSAVPNWLQKLGILLSIMFGLIVAIQKILPKKDIIAQSYRPWIEFKNADQINVTDSTLHLGFKITNTGIRSAELKKYDYCLLAPRVNFRSGRSLGNKLTSNETVGWSVDIERLIAQKKYFISNGDLENLIVAYKILFQDEVTKEIDSTLYIVKSFDRKEKIIDMTQIDPDKNDSLYKQLNAQSNFWIDPKKQ